MTSSVAFLLFVCVGVFQITNYGVDATGCSNYDLSKFQNIANPRSMEYYPIKWALGKKIYVEAIDTTQSRVFSINLVDGKGTDQNYFFHHFFYYPKIHAGYDVLKNGNWENPELIQYTQDTWPLETNVSFCVEVVMLADSFKVTLTQSTGKKIEYCWQYRQSVVENLKTSDLYVVVRGDFTITKLVIA